MNINPYIAGAPVIEEKMFFGREGVFDWIENSLAGKYVDHILVLHGQRRVGKTSILKHIPNRLPNRYLPILIDLQGRVSTTLPRFLWWLSREMVKALNNEGIELPKPDRNQFEEDPDYFENNFLPMVEAKLGDKRILLTFDEFDTLESTDAQEGLALPFMAILKRMMEYKKLNFVFSIGSSGRKLENMQAAYTSFFKQALYRKISFLDHEDGMDLIIKPVEGVLKYSPDAVDRILDVTSGHPYFVQLVCHELFSECQKTDHWEVNAQDVEKILVPTIERGTVNLKFVWDEANDFEKWILAALASTDVICTADELSAILKRERVRFTNQDLERSLLYLKEKDVLNENNGFVIHLLKMWMQMNRPMEQVREELKEVNPIVSRLLEIGQEYYEYDQFDEAIENFQKALAEDGDNLEAHIWLGNSQYKRGDYGKAVAQFEQVLDITADDVVAQKGFCDAYFAMGEDGKNNHKLAEAEYAYLQVLNINPTHKLANRRLAEIHHHRAVLAFPKDPDSAISELENANEIAKDAAYPLMINEIKEYKVGKNSTADVLLMWGMQAQKLELWENARELFKAYQQETGDEQKVSKSILEAVQKISENRIEYLRGRADRMERIGRYTEAIEAWHEYIQSDPEDKEFALETIKQLEKLAKESEKQEKSQGNPAARNIILGVIAFFIFILGIMGILPNSPLRLAFSEATPTIAVALAEPTATTQPSPTPTLLPTTIPLGWTRQNSLTFLDRDTITALAINPHDADFVLAGTENAGIFKSYNGGISWEPASNGLDSVNITYLAYANNDESTIIAGTSAGLFFSTNDGDQWNKVLDKNIAYIALNPDDISIMYAIESTRGIYKTMDQGNNWDLLYEYDNQLEADGHHPFLSEFYVNPNTPEQLVGYSENNCPDNGRRCIYISNNGGESWDYTGLGTAQNESEDGAGAVFSSDNPDQFMVVLTEIYITRDGGQTWETSASIPCFLTALPENSDTIYCVNGWNESFHVSNDFGATWERTFQNKDLPNYMFVLGGPVAVAPTNPDVIFTGGNYGLFKSTNKGLDWEETINGIGSRYIDFAFDILGQNTIYLQNFQEGVYCPLFESNDLGQNWELLHDYSNYCGITLSIDGEYLYRRSPQTWSSHNLIEENDWQYFDNPFSNGTGVGLSAHPTDANKIYFTTIETLNEYSITDNTNIVRWDMNGNYSLAPGIVYAGDDTQWYSIKADSGGGIVTKDAGENWQQCNENHEDIFSNTGSNIVVDPVDANKLYGGTKGYGIYISTDACASWTPSNSGLKNLFVNSIVIDPQNPDTIYAGTHQGVYVSFDAGETWGSINDGLLGQLVIYTLAFDPHNPDNLYAATPYGLFKLTAQ